MCVPNQICFQISAFPKLRLKQKHCLLEMDKHVSTSTRKNLFECILTDQILSIFIISRKTFRHTSMKINSSRQADMEEHSTVHFKMLLSCFLCEKVFVSKLVRDFHLECSHGCVQYYCYECANPFEEERFDSLLDLFHHIFSCHQDYPYQVRGLLLAD